MKMNNKEIDKLIIKAKRLALMELNNKIIQEIEKLEDQLEDDEKIPF
jgi:hypothetical protein|tara:strand:- start:355 stop:495 length:141 start_codon:yes stop_codon:yes gene_type:complete